MLTQAALESGNAYLALHPELATATPQAIGSSLHAQFAIDIRNNPAFSNFTVEQSFDSNGFTAKYGDANSIRTDVIEYDPLGNPIAIYDYKIGNTLLSYSRKQEILNQIFPSGVPPNVPILPIYFMVVRSDKGAFLCKPNPSIFVEGISVENTPYKEKSYAWVFSCPTWNIDTHLTLSYGKRITSGAFLEGNAQQTADMITSEILGTAEEHHVKVDNEISLPDFLDKYYNRFDLYQATQAFKLKDFAIAHAALGNVALAYAALTKLRSIYRQPERLGVEVTELISCIENSGDCQEIIDRMVQEGKKNFQQLGMK